MVTLGSKCVFKGPQADVLQACPALGARSRLLCFRPEPGRDVMGRWCCRSRLAQATAGEGGNLLLLAQTWNCSIPGVRGCEALGEADDWIS